MSTATAIITIESDADIERCFPIMQQLRPHLQPTDFVQRVRRQANEGYRLAALTNGAQIAAVAGYRVRESLFLGRFLYVDDLVTDAALRSRGHGKMMLEWLIERARADGCTHLELDSGVQRLDAHRFYLRAGMAIRSHHFSLPLR